MSQNSSPNTEKWSAAVPAIVFGAGLLALCQMLAIAVVRLTGLPVSVPVLGMFFMVLLLARLGETPPGLRRVAAFLLRFLTLLFVPAGVGVMLYFEPLRGQWLALLLTLLLSTIIAMAFTGWLLQRLLGRAESPQ